MMSSSSKRNQNGPKHHRLSEDKTFSLLILSDVFAKWTSLHLLCFSICTLSLKVNGRGGGGGGGATEWSQVRRPRINTRSSCTCSEGGGRRSTSSPPPVALHLILASKKPLLDSPSCRAHISMGANAAVGSRVTLLFFYLRRSFGFSSKTAREVEARLSRGGFHLGINLAYLIPEWNVSRVFLPSQRSVSVLFFFVFLFVFTRMC